MTDARPKRGPVRRYSPEVEQEQRALAESLLTATWADIIHEFRLRGWKLSQGTLQKRFREWGLVKGW